MKHHQIFPQQFSFLLFIILFSFLFLNNNKVSGNGVPNGAQKNAKREQFFREMAKPGGGLEVEADFLKELENFDEGFQELIEFEEKQEASEKIKKDFGGKPTTPSKKKVGVGARLRQAYSAMKKMLTGRVNIMGAIKVAKKELRKKDKTVKKYLKENCNGGKGNEIKNKKATLLEKITKSPAKFIKRITKLLYCNIKGNCKPERKVETCAMVVMVRSREYAEMVEQAEKEHIKGYIENKNK